MPSSDQLALLCNSDGTRQAHDYDYDYELLLLLLLLLQLLLRPLAPRLLSKPVPQPAFPDPYL